MDWTLQAIEVVNKYLKPGLQGIATLTTLGDFNADGTLHAKDWHIVQEVVTSIANCGVSAKEILRFARARARSGWLVESFLRMTCGLL